MPTFNFEFSVGTIIVAVTFIASMGAFYYGTRNDLLRFKGDFAMAMAKIEENLAKLNKVILDIALSNQRQDNYERRTDETFGQLKEDIKELRNRINQ